ncbi:hypothetical protein [Aestuariivirga sp.]
MTKFISKLLGRKSDAANEAEASAAQQRLLARVARVSAPQANAAKGG